MCGICGILNDNSSTPDLGLLRAMTATLTPRGPDAEGLHAAPGIGLGHRRLKVIDLTGSAQPMPAPGGLDVWLAYNGEVYNFQELGRTLQGKGHSVSLASDTEVVLHGYLEWGPGVVERLDGMFALAIWDGRSRELLLARDRMGEKPLYLARLPHALLFGSELKALVAHPELERRLDLDSLRRYLVHEYVPDPQAILQDVWRLEPGHLARVRQADLGVRPERYWDLRFPPPGSPERSRMRFDEATEELEARLQRAARRRLVADVPLGVFLSGGIDSSSLVALLSNERPGGSPLQTFSIGFADPSFDESGPARLVAERFGTAHREERFDEARLLGLLDPVSDLLDEPFADPSILPTHLLSIFTRQHVTVALSGDGGDELLAGYPTFLAEPFGALAHRWLPTWALPPLRAAASRLPVSTRNISFDFKIKQFLRGLDHAGAARHQVWLGSFTPTEVLALLTPEARAGLGPVDPLDEIVRRVGQTPAEDPWDRLLVFYCKYYLAGDILVKADRASMAVGLEVRAPFLDPEVVDLACRLPPWFRRRRLTTKAIGRAVAARHLPAAITRRPKKGFGIPVARWLKGPLRERMEALLSPERLRREGLFRPGPVRALVQDHLAGRVDARKPIYTLMAFQAWQERFLPGGPLR
jgi:asparagine synthase (glutamine-hydrolysing)